MMFDGVDRENETAEDFLARMTANERPEHEFDAGCDCDVCITARTVVARELMVEHAVESVFLDFRSGVDAFDGR